MRDQSADGRGSLIFFQDVVEALRVLRGPLVIAILAFVALSVPAATKEAYRTLFEDAAKRPEHIAFAAATLMLAAASVWYAARDASLFDEASLNASGAKGFLLRWLPLACALFVLLGAAWGLYQAAASIERVTSVTPVVPATNSGLVLTYPSPMVETSRQLGQLFSDMELVGETLLVAAFAVLAVAAALALAGVLIGMRTERVELRRSALFARPVKVAFVALAFATIAAFCISQFELPRALGTVAIFNIFIVVLATIIGLFVYIQRRHHLPLITIAVGAAILFSVFGLNDNHVVTPVESSIKFANGMNATHAASPFVSWLNSRADKEAYGAEPYPVFFVSASGGGLYAAQYAAKFLARMQDACPHFAQHVFAISGVSGGSVGASVFASLVGQEVKPVKEPSCRDFGLEPGPLETKADAILGKDYLSPIVAATLFPDFLQRFLPFPVPRFDRGQVLDTALEQAWRDLYPSKDIENPFEMPLQDIYSSLGAAPALILNATQIATGGRVVIAPFYFRPEGGAMVKLDWLQRFIQAPNPENIVVDLKLSTAAGISARFPWVMPAATVKGAKTADGQRKIRLVDGGYFENSGADSAADLIRTLRPHMDSRKVKIMLIVLTGYDGEFFADSPDDATAMGELLSPVRTLLSTRQARADLTILRTADYLCPDMVNCETGSDFRGQRAQRKWNYDAQWVFAGLNLKDYDLPLSWHLSGYTRRFIGLHAGLPSECGYSRSAMLPLWTELREPKHRGMRVLGAMNASNCAASVICGQMSTRQVEVSKNPVMQIENYCGAWEGKPALTMGVNPAQ